ncbi:AAA family ATPase [Actinosynnema sp. NPDC023587]|uniref:nSTAND1 domain-containing NTPase n=1 Tax=Actinosynnema sp. NPDC023587 TaxID=3154695 RepID=UPI0033E81D70
MPRGESPLQPDGSALTDFALDLRRLRTRAGMPSYRQLARWALYSPTTLSDAAGGKKLPSLAVTTAFVRACGGDETEWARRWRELSTELAGPPTPTDGGVVPYPGLAPYEADDAEWFHGRQTLVGELAAKVAERRFTAVFGASGAGKSSLLRAGLVPRLTAEGTWIALFTPGADPFGECAAHLARWLGTTAGVVRAELAADPANLHRLVRQALVAEPPDRQVVLVVDQFEELFTLCADPATRSAFLAALVRATRADKGRCRVVLGVRADFRTRCLRESELSGVLDDPESTAAELDIKPMTVEQLRSAIVEPAKRAGCVVEGALVAALVAEVHGRIGVLPLLSHAMRETWLRRKGNTLTLAGFQRTGGIDGALANSAESLYSALDDARREVAKDLLLRMVASGDDGEDTRRRVDRAELDAGEDVDAVLGELAAARLVVLSGDRAEITHEALIDAWPRLRVWLTEDRDGRRAHRRLTVAATLWRHHHRDPDLLLRGSLLAQTSEWARTHGHLNRVEREFLDSGLSADRRERTKRRHHVRLVRALAALVVVLAVFAALTAIYATNTQRAATRQHTIALADDAVETAARLSDTDPALAAGLLLAAYRLAPSEQTASALVSASGLASGIGMADDAGSVVAAAGNGRLAAVARQAADVTILVALTADTATPIGSVPGGQGEPVFSADSRVVATRDRDGIRLWDIGDPARPVGLGVVPGRHRAVRFSPDGALLVTVDVVPVTGSGETQWVPGRSGRLWDVRDPHGPHQLGALPGANTLFEFSGDSRLLVTLDLDSAAGTPYDQDLEIWDLGRPDAPQVVGRVDSEVVGSVSAVAFAGYRGLVVGDLAGGVTFWNLADPVSPRMVVLDSAHQGSVNAVAVSPDQRQVVTAGSTGDLVLWTFPKPQELRRKTDAVRVGSGFTGLRFAPDGQSVHALKHTSIISAIRWHLDPERAAAAACARPSAGLTPAEWSTYFPELPYLDVC